MPTSKARKRKIVARLKEKEKIALEKKSKLGLKKCRPTSSHQRSSRAVSKIAGFLRYSMDTAEEDITKHQDESPTELHTDKTESQKDVSFPTTEIKRPNEAAMGKEVDENENLMISGSNQKVSSLQTSKNKEQSCLRPQSTTSSPDVEKCECASYQGSGFSFGVFSFKIWNTLCRLMLVPFTSSQEFVSLKNRITDLEQEVENLKLLLQTKSPGGCLSASGPAAPFVNVVSLPAPPPPPPPPPPLPPPLLPVAAALKKRKSEGKKTTNEIVNKGNSKTTLHVTNDQLLNVKLKKVNFKNNVSKQTPVVETGQLVTLSKKLKKVDVARSPGGTPLVKVKKDTGAGLTPLLTAALKRKFMNANQTSFDDTPEF